MRNVITLFSTIFQLNFSRNPPKNTSFISLKVFPQLQEKRECEKSKYAQEQKTIIESGKLKLKKVIHRLIV